jgi:hypothetical protein
LQHEKPEPAVPHLRRTYPGIDDDELLLRAMFIGTQVDEMKAAAKKTQTPLEELREIVAAHPKIAFFSLSTPAAKVEVAQ